MSHTSAIVKNFEKDAIDFISAAIVSGSESIIRLLLADPIDIQKEGVNLKVLIATAFTAECRL
jgi:hypothetical protein